MLIIIECVQCYIKLQIWLTCASRLSDLLPVNLKLTLCLELQRLHFVGEFPLGRNSCEHYSYYQTVRHAGESFALKRDNVIGPDCF